MAAMNSNAVLEQPHIHQIGNDFGLMGNEVLLHEWTVENKSWGCVPTTHQMTLTDTRLLIRTVLSSCGPPTYMDTSIFLRDIAELRESRKTRYCWSLLCTKFCGLCRAPRLIEVRGVFGSQRFHILEKEEQTLKVGLPAAIGNHKLVDHLPMSS